MDILNNLLSSDAYTPVNKYLARELWFVCAGLWELIRQRARFWNKEFYFCQSDMENEIWISPFQQRECIKKLKDLWILEVKKKWIPCKNYYLIYDDFILTIVNNKENVLNNKKLRNLTTGDKENSQQAVKKLDDYYNNNNNNKNNNKKEKKEKFKEFVLLYPEEYKKLIDIYGKKVIDNIIDNLNNYIWSTWKKYKSHYHTILNWLKRDNIKPKPKEINIYDEDEELMKLRALKNNQLKNDKII